MLLQFLASALLFAGLCLGVAWPIMARREMAAAEKLIATVVLSLLGIFMWAWLVYILALPRQTLYVLPVVAIGGLAIRLRELRALLSDATVAALLGAQALVAAGCIVWLATIASYSGGGWAGDWAEHWERTSFFLTHAPLETKFIGIYALTARPPLANVVTGAFIALTRFDFAHYQVVMTLLASAAFLPAALLAARWGTARAIAVLAALLLVSPLFLQNATFAWTKLPTAFFALAAVYFFLRARDADAPRAAGPLVAASLAAATLTHYSAGPYLVVLVAAWFVLGWRQREAGWWKRTLVMAAIGSVLLVPWFGWSLAVFGIKGTFLTNSSVTAPDAQQGSQVVKIAANLFDTIVPHFLRPLDTALIAQRSPWGAVRDWFFQGYQVNLLLVFGSVAWLVIARELAAAARVAGRTSRGFWTAFVAGVIFLGVATHGQRDHWGLAHICLQPLALMGLAFLAARWERLTRPWRTFLIAGATIDAVCGVALQFATQNFACDRWFASGVPAAEIFTSYNRAMLMNLQAKVVHQLAFFSDRLAAPFALCVALAAGLLVTAIIRARTAPPPAGGGPVTPAAGDSYAAAAATRHERWRAVLALVAAVFAAGHLWFGWCVFPVSSWNEARLAPAFALRHGSPLYVPLDGGPLSTWIYGPVGPLVNLPATFAASVIGAIKTAGVINLLVLALPLAIVCLSAAEVRRLGWPAKVCAVSVATLALPANALAYQVADHTAFALALLSCAILTRPANPTHATHAVAAALAVASLWAKQLAVFVPVAQVGFLAWHHGRASAWRHAGWVAAFGIGSLLLTTAWFGFGNLWLNLVAIPGRLPSVNLAAKAAEMLPALAGYVALPLAAALGLRAAGAWPGRESATGRLLRCTFIVAVAVLPIGLLALFKIGGAINVVHSWYYLLAPITVVTTAAAWRHRRAWGWLSAAIVALCLLRLPELRSLPAGPYTAHLAEAERLAAAGRGTIWFPYNPLVTFYSDGKLYHDEDGIMTRSLARFGLREVDPRHLPAPLAGIAYDAQQPAPLALRLFPAYTQRSVAGYWAVYRREPAAAK